MLEPTALTCAPGASHSRRTIGSRAVVQVQTTSAPRSASSAVPPSRRLQVRISASPRTALIASACERAWTPAPRMATIRAPPGASARVATAETAAVRISVIARGVQDRAQLARLAVVQQDSALVGVEAAGRVTRRDHDLLQRPQRVLATARGTASGRSGCRASGGRATDRSGW